MSSLALLSRDPDCRSTGILPRNGRNIPIRALTPAIRSTFNFAPSFSVFVPRYIGQILGRSYLNDTLDLEDIDVHNGIEHDASLTREFYVYGGGFLYHRLLCCKCSSQIVASIAFDEHVFASICLQNVLFMSALFNRRRRTRLTRPIPTIHPARRAAPRICFGSTAFQPHRGLQCDADAHCLRSCAADV